MSKYTARRIWMRTAAQQKLENIKLTEKTVRRTNVIYRQASKDIERQVEAIYKQLGVLDKVNHWNFKGLNNPTTKKDATALISAIEKAGLSDYVPEKITKRLSVVEAKQLESWLTLHKAGQDSHALTKEALLKTMSGSGKIWQRATEAGVESFIGFDRNICGYMMGANWGGGNFSSRLWNATNETWERVREELARALANGQQPETTRKHIQDLLRGYHNGEAKGSGGLAYDVERIVRTEMAKASTDADMVRWHEMGVEKVQWNASFEVHTCEACGERDGRVYELENLRDTIPLHPNCRCYFTPYDEAAEAVAKRTAEYKDEDGEYQRIEWAPLQSLMQYGGRDKGYSLRKDPIPVDDYFFSVSPFTQYTPARTGLKYTGEINKDFIDIAENTIQDVINQFPEVETEMKRWANGEVVLHRGQTLVNGNKIEKLGGWVDASRKEFMLTYPAGLTGNIAKELQEIATRSFKSGDWSSDKYNHAVRHELGHILARRVEARGIKLDDFIKAVTKASTTKQAMDKIATISKYGSTNPDEAFAELFARSMAQDVTLNNKLVADFTAELQKTLRKPVKTTKISL